MDVIFRKIKNLQRIQPDASWLIRQRSFLLSEIFGDQKPIKERKAVLAFPFFDFSKIFRPAFAVAFTIIILVSSFATVGAISASQNSLPGDFLYQVKTVLEKTQLTFTHDSASRTRLSVKFANQRMDEFTQMIQKPEKKEDIQKTVKGFTQQMVAVQQEMNILKEKNAEKATEVAKLVQAQTPVYEEALIKGDEKLGYVLPGEKQGLKDDINQALEELNKTKELANELTKEETSSIQETENETENPEEIIVPGEKAEQTESVSVQFENLQPTTEGVEVDKVE